MDKLYTVIELTAPNTYQDKSLTNYIALPCIMLEKIENEENTTEYIVSINIDDKFNKIPFHVNGKYLNIKRVSKVFTTLYECKKEASTLNDCMVRSLIKKSPLSEVRELSKVLRQNLNFAENLQNSLLYNNENEK